jgi:tetratricopeptide (TPR) repeat protein
MLRNTRCLLLALVVVVACLHTGRPSFAQSKRPQSAESHYRKGKKAYTVGHFAEAIEEFEKAFDIKPEPVFLFNMAQAHRQNGNLQRAIFFYRRYLEADPTAKDRADIEKRIKEGEAELAAEKEHRLAPPPPPAPIVVVAPPQNPTPAATVQSPPVQPNKPEETHGRGLVIAGIVTGSVGLVAIGIGVFATLHADSLHSQAYSGQYDNSKEQSSKTYRTLELTSFIVGGAALGTGAVLLILGATSKGDKPSVALAPFLVPGAGGASVWGRF